MVGWGGISTLPENYEQYHLGDLAIDWNLSKREIEKIVKDIKQGERLVSWILTVEVSKLREHPRMKRKITSSQKPLPRDTPVLVHINEYILDFKIGLDELLKRGQPKVLAEIFYPVNYLRSYAVEIFIFSCVLMVLVKR